MLTSILVALGLRSKCCGVPYVYVLGPAYKGQEDGYHCSRCLDAA